MAEQPPSEHHKPVPPPPPQVEEVNRKLWATPVVSPENNNVNVHKKTKNKNTVITLLIILLIILVGGTGFIVYQYMAQQTKLEAVNEEIKSLIEENTRLQEQVDAKETFNSVVHDIYTEWRKLEGTPYIEKAQTGRVVTLVQGAYDIRTSPADVNVLTDTLRELLGELQVFTNSMEKNIMNISGDSTESVTDMLSHGIVETTYYSSVSGKAPCEQIASACVWSNAPNMINFNVDAFQVAVKVGGPDFAEWWKKGVAYHEFAHVLQNFNPTATESVLATFDNNKELMADCYASAYFGGNEFITYNYNLGCTATQIDAVKAWADSLKITVPTITQG